MRRQSILVVLLALFLLPAAYVLNLLTCRWGLGFQCKPISDFDPKMTFLDYCQSTHTFDINIVEAVTAVKKLSGHEDCSDAFRVLNEKSRINLSKTKLKNIFPLANLKSLKTLNLAQNEIIDLRPIQTLPTLERLNLSDNRISDISALGSLIQLKWLELSYNNIEKLDALHALTQLRVLRLDRNPIRSVEPLKKISGLTHYHFFEGLSLKDLPLGTREAKTEENCPTREATSPAVKVWCLDQHLPILTTHQR